MQDDNKINSQLGQLERVYTLHNNLAVYFSKKHGIHLTRYDIFNALFLMLCDKEDMDYPLFIWDLDLSIEEGVELLKSFDFSILQQEIDIDIIPHQYLMQRKVRFKAQGQIWVIHKNDVDPFPSIPHAHTIDDNLKLDLSNGNCFRKRKLICTVSYKSLLKIREEAVKVFKGNLPELVYK